MKIAVTRMSVQQVSPDDFKEIYYTKIFEDTTPIRDLLIWGNTKLINDLDFSTLEE